MKSYKLFLWLLFIILALNGCEDFELDSQAKDEALTEMNSDVVLKSARDLNRIESSSGESLKITEVGNILDLPETSLPGKAHSWYLPISFYSGRLGKISVGSLAGYPYWNATKIDGINVYGSPSAGEMMYYDGRDYRFTPIPSCLWTENDSDIYHDGGNVGIKTTSPSSYLSVGGTGHVNYAIHGSGNTYGVKGMGSSIGVLGEGDNAGVYGFDSNSHSEGYLAFGDYGVHGIGITGVQANGSSYDFYASGSGTNYGPFTGGHEVKLSKGSPRNADIRPGMIVSVTGETQLREDDIESASLSSTLPSVELANHANDKKVFGVFTNLVPLSEDHWFYDNIKPEDRFATVNSLGEGRVLVTDINGEIEAGDYITTSNIPGYGMKQDDDLLHNYTLGKAIEDVNWSEVEELVDHDGEKYKVFLISVVYTSG